MSSYIIRRVLLIIPTVFFAISFLFFLFFVLPGDPATLIAGGKDRTVDPACSSGSNERYGLDDPLLTQFVHYWQRTLHWDLGDSYRQQPQRQRDPRRAGAVTASASPSGRSLIEIVIGISVGLLSAVRRYSFSDKLTTIGPRRASAIPVFVLGLRAAIRLRGRTRPSRLAGVDATAHVRPRPRHVDAFFIPIGEQWRYLILPAITLACVSTALAARMIRGSMLEVLQADYMRTARAKGLGERDVVLRHGLRNAMLPVVTLIGIDFGTVIGAAVLTETVFSWPGLGSQIADSVANATFRCSSA